MDVQRIYVPGVCNIGEEEIRRRRRFGWINLVLFLILFAVLIAINAPPLVRLVLFIPAFGAAMGFVQAKMHFCAYFGLVGLFNVKSTAATPEEIWEDELRKTDQRKAWSIIGISLLIGGVLAVIAYLIPV